MQRLIVLVLTALLCAVDGRSTSQTVSAAKLADNYDGSREVMVHLFEWNYADVAKECEQFLSKFGYTMVQVSPPGEHIRLQKNGDYPWWIKYQPANYQICSRSGDANAFKDMTARCKNVGIKIIADTATNHMVGQGQQGQGWCGSSFNCQDHGESFPGVPYGPNDFNDNICDHDIDNYNDAWNVRKCRLVDLADINQDNEYPRQKIAAFLSSLIDAGAGGIRIDAAKHQYPDHLADIIGRMQKPADGNLLVVQEVIDMKSGEAVHAGDYVGNGRVTNFIYGQDVSAAVRRSNNFKYFGNFGASWNMWADNDVLVMIDNHDNQRGHGGNTPLTYKNSYQYTMAVTYMLSWPYGLPRVMSSYYFTDSDAGPPHSGDTVNGPSFRNDLTCDPSSGWVCEHRWPEVRRMSMFRKVTAGQPVANIATDDHRIAFSRGNKGWFAVNNNPSQTWTETFETGLPSGTYCDVISGEPTDTGCTGTTVNVGGDGKAQISVSQGKTFGLYVGAQPGNPITAQPGHSTLKPVTQPTGPPGSKQKTIVYLKKSTTPGQNVFMRGGAKCATGQCSISINDVTTGISPTCGANYVKWAVGDNTLDWAGKDSGQAANAEGTPMIYTTNVKTEVCYDCLNGMEALGEGYWKAEMMMDCSATNNGWFEFKGYMNGWENDVSQSASCAGSASASTPYTSNNHLAKCGSINVYTWGSGDCRIESMKTC